MANAGPKIVVVGATFVDMAFRCEEIPTEGQQVAGSGLSYTPTGPGPCQALQAVLCDCEVHLVSKVGGGPFGAWIIQSLNDLGINTDYVITAEAMNTGVDVTLVNPFGENAVCRYAGANMALQARDVMGAEELISQADVCLVHGHLPQEAVVAAIRCAKVHGKKVILHPALPPAGRPATHATLPNAYFDVDVMVSNLYEAAAMAEQSTADIHAAKLIGSDLVARGVHHAVVTEGRRGSLIVDRQGAELVPSFEIELLDCTGRADAFAGALAASLGVGDALHDAVTFASAAGALACTTFGSIESMSAKADIIQLLQDRS